MLLILVSFADRQLGTTPASWNSLVFDSAAKSVAKYYNENSFNTLTITPVATSQPETPAGIVSVTLDTNHPNTGSYYTFASDQAWGNAALQAAYPYVDYDSLDANRNGILEPSEVVIYFVVAGYETSANSGSSPSVWAHAWRTTGTGLTAGTKNVQRWSQSGEYYNETTQMTMGVIAHELGHQMGGLPDLYDTANINGAMGIFSLMAGGSWGGDVGETGGTTPTALDAWSREFLGWATPVTPTSSGSLSLAHPLSSRSAAYKFVSPLISTSEYFLVENRQPIGWDLGIKRQLGSGWLGGLLITHIDISSGTYGSNDINSYTANNVASGGHQGVVPVQASTASCNMLTTSNRGCPTILYYAGNNSTWNQTTAPNSHYYNGLASSFSLGAVSAPAAAMTGSITFAQPPSKTLTITPTGTGTGSISSIPAGIACGSTCAKTFPQYSRITLTAVPNAGTTFTGWSGGGCSGTGPCVVNLTDNTLVTANFVPLVAVLSESFDTSTAPSGWSVIDNATTNAVWRFDDPATRTNQAGGTGSFAIADSDHAGAVQMDTELRTPSLNLTGYSAVMLNFKTYFEYFTTETSSVDVSINGASGPWTTIWSKSGVDYGPATEQIDISAIAAGQSNVMVRFRYYDANYEWYWQIDDVSVKGIPVQQQPLTLSLLTSSTDGTTYGGGTVTGNGISCQSQDGATSGTCSGQYDSGSSITLTATEDNSIFSSWSGCSSSNQKVCSVTMDASRSVTASFALVGKVRIGAVGYNTLQAAHAAAAPASSTTIKARRDPAFDDGTLTISKPIILKGGYDMGYTSNADAFSTLAGTLTIGSGSLTVENLIIR
jgi:M6 family metalloprotease-like protein